jgi:hypothetical protein
MKSPEMVLRSALVGSTAFTSLCSSKVFPLAVPEKDAAGNKVTLPFVTWRRASIQRSQTLGAPMGMPRVTVEYSIYSTTYESARGVADTMRQILDGYGGSVDNTTVEQTSLENESDDFVQLAGAEMPSVYSVTQTYDVWWQET